MREGALRAIERTRETGSDLVQITVHSGPCDACLRVQGRVFSISGKTPGFPALTDDVLPPLHRGCGHVLVGVNEFLLKERGQWEPLQRFSSDENRAVADLIQYQGVLAGKSPGREFAEAQKVAQEFRSSQAARKPKRRRRRKPRETAKKEPAKEETPASGCCSLALLALPYHLLRGPR